MPLTFLHGPTRRARLALLLLLIAFSATGVFDHSLWAPNDSHEGSMIAEMYRSGRWTALFVDGQPFLEKPPLLHWIALIVCTVAGRLGPGLVRVPAAAFGLATSLVVWEWGRRLAREESGMLAALFCVTNITYYERARVVLTDIALTFVVTLGFFAFWSAFAGERGKIWRYALFVAVASFSFYAKGLAGPAFIMSSVVGFLLVSRRWRLAAALSLAVVPAIIAAVYPWALALYRQGGPDYLVSAFIDNQLGRFFGLFPGAPVTSLPFFGRWLGFIASRPVPADPYFVHKEPIYHYLVKLPVRLLPWTFLVPSALGFWFGRRRSAGSLLASPAATFLRCALVTIVVILHVASSKVGSYALPCFPVLFLMVAVWCEEAGKPNLTRFDAAMVSSTSWLVCGGAVVVPGLYLLLLALPRQACAGFAELLRRLDPPTSYGDPAAFVWAPGRLEAWVGAGLCAAALAIAIPMFRMARARFDAGDRVGGFRGLAAALAIVSMLAGTAAMPGYDRQRSYQAVVDMVSAESARGRRIALAIRDTQITGEFIFYTGLHLPSVDPVPGVRRFLLQDSQPRGVLVCRHALDDVKASLEGTDYEIVTPGRSAGLNGREFVLIVRGVSASSGARISPINNLAATVGPTSSNDVRPQRAERDQHQREPETARADPGDLDQPRPL